MSQACSLEAHCNTHASCNAFLENRTPNSLQGSLHLWAMSPACVPDLCFTWPHCLKDLPSSPRAMIPHLQFRLNCPLAHPKQSTLLLPPGSSQIHFPPLATWYARLSPDAAIYLGESNIGGHSGQVRKSQKAWGSLLGP